MRKMVVFLMMAIILFSGCGTMEAMITGKYSYIYAGTITSLCNAFDEKYFLHQNLMYLIDIPFSFTADTYVVVMTIFDQLTRVL